VNQVTSASLRYPLSVFNKNSTLKPTNETGRASCVDLINKNKKIRKKESVDMSCLFCSTYDDDASGLAPTLVRLLPIARVWSRSLSLFSALVCDLLPRRLFHGSPKAHCQKSTSVTILTSTAWRTLGLFGTFPTLVGGHH